MRQLGVRLAEPPPAETDVETPPNVPLAMPTEPSPEAPRVEPVDEPYPVERAPRRGASDRAQSG